MNTINLPNHWKPPKYAFGDRVKQGVIVGLENYPIDSYLGQKYGRKWRYTLLPDKTEEEVDYFLEGEIEPLLPEEIRTEIQAEIQFHKTALDVLTSEEEKLYGSKVTH